MSITACLIALNEEYFIRQCLEALTTYPLDEIVIVDGGSTDATLDVIESFKDSGNVWLYENPMPYSFSEQRNFARKHASCDWILSLDVDETLKNAEALPALREQLNDNGKIAASFPTDHLKSERGDADPHIRFFKNIPEIQWTRPIHEYLMWGDIELRPHPANMAEQKAFIEWAHHITVVHWAYTAPEERLRQKARNYMKYNKEGAGIQINDEEDLIPK